jgi:hypothetical protein
MHFCQMHLEAEQAWPCRLEPQKAGRDPWLKIDADRAHVANDLSRRLLECEVQAFLAASARGIDEVVGQAGLAGPGRARHQDARSTVEASDAEHRVEAGDACRDSLVIGVVRKPSRGDRQHGNALVVDQERIFVGAMRRAAIFDDADAARGDLVLDPVVEQQHAVGNILFQTVARQRPFASLGRDDRGDVLFLQPGKQTAQFGAQDVGVAETGEQHFQRIEHHALGADLIDRVAKAHKQPVEIVVSGLFDLALLDTDVIHRNAFLIDEALHVVTERYHVLNEIFAGFLEAHEHARFIKVQPRH